MPVFPPVIKTVFPMRDCLLNKNRRFIQNLLNNHPVNTINEYINY